MEQTALLYSLITALLFGIANVATQEMTRVFGALRATVLRSGLGVVLMMCALPILHIKIVLDWQWIFLGIPIACGGYLGFLCFMIALRNGKMGVVLPISTSFVIVSSVFGFLFLGDVLQTYKVVMVVVVVLGVVASSTDGKSFKNSDIFSLQSGVPHALLCSLFWGISLPLYRYPSDHLGALPYALLIGIVITVCALAQLFIFPKYEMEYSYCGIGECRGARLWSVVGIAIVTSTVAGFLTNLSYQTGQVSIVSAIIQTQTIVSIIIGMLAYRDMLTKLQYVGAVLVTLGIMLPLLL